MQHTLLSFEEVTYEELQSVAARLKSDYESAAKNNPERIKMIELANVMTSELKALPSDESTKILKGLYIFVMEVLENEYQSYERVFWSRHHSQLYSSLATHLNIPDYTQLDLQTRTIYLAEFYEYIEKNAEHVATQTRWGNQETLMTAVKSVAKALLAKQATHIDMLLTTRPVEDRLKANITNMEAQYLKDCEEAAAAQSSSWLSLPFSYKKHSNAPYAKFIDFINQHCIENLDNHRGTELNLDLANQGQKTYMLRAAAVVYVMLSIEKSYTLLTMARGTKLYDLCRHALSVDTTGNIPPKIMRRWLQNLNDELEDMVEYRKNYLDKMTSSGYTDLKKVIPKIRLQISKYVSDCLALEGNPNISQVTEGVGNVANAVIQARAPEIFKQATNIDPAKIITKKIVKVTGDLVFGDKAKYLVFALNATVIPLFANICCDTVFEKVGSVVVKGAANIVCFPIVAAVSGILALAEMFKDDVDVNDLRKRVDWIQALMKFPDELFDMYKKKIIENITGLEVPVMNEVKPALAK